MDSSRLAAHGEAEWLAAFRPLFEEVHPSPVELQIMWLERKVDQVDESLIRCPYNAGCYLLLRERQAN